MASFRNFRKIGGVAPRVRPKPTKVGIPYGVILTQALGSFRNFLIREKLCFIRGYTFRGKKTFQRSDPVGFAQIRTAFGGFGFWVSGFESGSPSGMET